MDPNTVSYDDICVVDKLASSMYIMYQPLDCALAVYHIPWASVVALAYFRSSLSRSLESIAMSARKGEMSSAFHFERVKKRSANRCVASTGRAEAGKYDKRAASLGEAR